MLRAVVLAARLEFTIDEPILEAIEHAPARDRAQRAAAAARGVLQDPALGARRRGVQAAGGDAAAEARSRRSCRRAGRVVASDRARWIATARDSTRRPTSLTNAILAGTLLQPLGLAGPPQRFSADPLERRVELGMLPIARRDVERLQQILVMQPRLLDLQAPFAPSAACCTAPSSTRRSPGWKSTATARTWSSTGASCRAQLPPGHREHSAAPVHVEQDAHPVSIPPPPAPPSLAARHRWRGRAATEEHRRTRTNKHRSTRSSLCFSDLSAAALLLLLPDPIQVAVAADEDRPARHRHRRERRAVELVRRQTRGSPCPAR